VVVSSYDERDGLIRCEYCWTDGARLDVSTFPPLPLNRQGGGMQSQVIVSGEPLVFNDVADVVKQPGGTYYDVDREGTFRKLPDSGPPKTRAAMMVPVKHEGKVVGVVQVMAAETDFSPEQLEIVGGLVSLMGAADRNARLHAERVRLEAGEAAALAIAAAREQAANVLDALDEGIFLVDRSGTVRLWNRAAEHLIGRSAEEVCGGPVTDALPDWQTLVGRIPVADHGATTRATTLPVAAGDRDLWLSFVAVGTPEGVVYAFRDLTAERGLDEQKSELMATISHELRTPMTAVYGAAQTLLRREDSLPDEKKRELVEMIATQAARLNRVTDEFLTATQLDRGTLAFEAEPVDVGSLVRSTVEAVAPNAAVEIHVARDLADASGAKDRIQQVLVNLLDNAVKYGAPPIGVRVESAGERIRIAITDSGQGIPRDEQQEIFERFYRSGSAQARVAGGTGLGLYISRELVRRMGGEIGVRSEPGHGATFVVELPTATEL
jgi:signal transduction histidine kinase